MSAVHLYPISNYRHVIAAPPPPRAEFYEQLLNAAAASSLLKQQITFFPHVTAVLGAELTRGLDQDCERLSWVWTCAEPEHVALNRLKQM